MRWASLIVLLVALAAVSPSGSPARAGPSLTIRSTTPLLVVGRGFAAQERVTVTVRRGSRRIDARAVRAGGGGAFRLKFPALLAADTCTGSLLVLAKGAEGSRAAARRPCLHPPDRRAVAPG
jgi:hypothetical protein